MTTGIIKHNFKTVDEWLNFRKPFIGGSEISAVVGVNPFMSRYELYQHKIGAAAPVEENEYMRLGHLLEDAVVTLLEEDAGYQIIKNTKGNLLYTNIHYPIAEASPDRLAYLPGQRKSEENKGIIEIKTTQKQVDPDNIPAHWICQAQWYMGIVGYKWAVIAWLSSGSHFGYKQICFDEEFFDMLMTEGQAFVDDIKAGREPEAITAADVFARYPRHEDGKTTEVNEAVALACEELKSVKAQAAELEARENELKETIFLAFKDCEAITYAGLTLATYKANKDSRKFDSKAFCAEHPELAEPYMKIAPGARRLVLK